MSKNKTASFDVIFIFALFFLFAILSLTIVAMGSKLYQKTTASVEASYESQTSLSYISNKIRYLGDGEVNVINDPEGPLLKITEKIEGDSYDTVIYFYNGHLCEQFIGSSDKLNRVNGEQIMQLKYYNVTESDNMLHFEILTTSGAPAKLSIMKNGGGAI